MITLNIFQPISLKDLAIEETFRSLDLDLIIVMAYGQILPQKILDLPKYGALNIHASILPRHRGAAPIQWAIIEGDIEVGEIAAMLGANPLNQSFGCNAFFARLEHDRRTMGILGTDIVSLVTLKPLKAGPNVSLNVFDQMSQMNRPVGVRQGTGCQDLARSRGHEEFSGNRRY